MKFPDDRIDPVLGFIALGVVAVVAYCIAAYNFGWLFATLGQLCGLIAIIVGVFFLIGLCIPPAEDDEEGPL